MNIGKYIQNLLTENEIVIVPGFGAFISTYKPAEIDNETGQISPPTKIVSFDSKIKYNDGLLADRVAETEQITTTEAFQKINQEKEEIIYSLDKNQKVTIENIGIFFSDADNQIHFEPFKNDNLLLDAFGLESTILKEPADEIRDDKKKAANETAFPPAKKVKSITEPVPTAEKTIQKPVGQPKRKKTGWLWLPAILLPLAAAGYFLFFGEEKVIEPPEVEVVAETPPEVEQTIIPVDTSKVDSVSISVSDSIMMMTETIDSTYYVRPDSLKYYLAAGSFLDAENAEKFLKKLKRAGYSPFHLGKHVSYFIVGIDVFENKTEAFGAQYNYLDKYPDSGAWIFHTE